MSTTATETQVTKEYLLGLLHDRNIKSLYITFTKSDGSERVMRCTLIDDKIPEDKKPKGTGSVSSESTQRVFDLDKQEWRSFKLDSIRQIEFDI